MRKVWLGSGPDVDDTIITGEELGWSAFALIVEHLPPRGREYRVKVRIVPRDEEIIALIGRHRLLDVELFVDPEAERLAGEQGAIGEEMKERLEQDGLSFIWSFDIARLLWRGTSAALASSRSVRLKVEDLLVGQEIKGAFNEVRWLVRQLSAGLDRLGAEIDAGRAFDGGEVRIYAPGKKQKHDKKKPQIPPSKW